MARRDKTTQYKTTQNNLGREMTIQHNNTIQNKTTQDKTIPYNNKQYHTRQCEIRQFMTIQYENGNTMPNTTM